MSTAAISNPDEGLQHFHNVPDMADTDQSDRETEPRVIKREDKKTRYKSFAVRTLSTFVLIASFVLIIYWGHIPLMFMIFGLQHAMVKELFAMARIRQADRKLPGFRAQQWYFFYVAAFYIYLRFIRNNLLVEITSDKRLAQLFALALRRHTIISYSLYIAGFVAFVLSLKRKHYSYQFSQYAWTHMIILVVVIPTSFFVSNIFEGIIWFILPAFLVVVNDIMAYLAGFFFGRTPLIKLSPKKTWEGFIGGFIGTVIAAYYLAKIFAAYTWMICPRKDLSIFVPLTCEPADIYTVSVYTMGDVATVLPPSLVEYLTFLAMYLPVDWQQQLAAITFTVQPIQVHAMVLAVFASIIAPFGGFFASGFKRAFKVKDFGDTIPGHGGVTDRFDCQVMMGVFSYVYYWAYVSRPELAVPDVLQFAMKLGDPQQVELFIKLGNLLAGEGLLPDSVADQLGHLLGNLQVAR